jgi:hypothetical protein
MTDEEGTPGGDEANLGAGSGGGRSFRGPAAHSGGEQEMGGPVPPYGSQEERAEGHTGEAGTGKTAEESETTQTDEAPAE